MRLRQIQEDPQYGTLVDELLDQIRPLAERSHPGMHRREAFLFISSREAVTPFHFDPEHNFLLQVRGSKTVHLWDPNDRAAIPAAALDAYYAALRNNRNQPFRDEFFTRAWERPREVVHTANGHLRRLGLEPPYPGTSPIWDRAAYLGYFAHHTLHKAGALAERVQRRLGARFGRH